MNNYEGQAHLGCFGLISILLFTRPVVFDAIMRVRTSTGVRPTDFFGAFYMVRIISALFSFDLISLQF